MDSVTKKHIESLQNLLPGGVAFQLTETMLKKSTIDASKSIRDFLSNNSLFDFSELPKGEKEIMEAQLFFRGKLLQRQVSLFRPNAKPNQPGDPRIWVYNLNKNVKINDWVYFAVKNSILIVIPIEKSPEFNQQIKNAFGELSYKVSTGLKNLIGKQLITDDAVAIFELVKNSFDAHAKRVEITFQDLYTKNGKITIQDDGKGMNLDELKNKWLFVGYSAKREGTEDEDYRHGLGLKRVYAGAKGVGRFSCDRLGSFLKLTTRKDEENSTTEVLYTDWKKFEEDSKARFEDIGVNHESLPGSQSYFAHGTILEISNLRSEWSRDKLKHLRASLEKLILPQSENDKNLKDRKHRPFEIIINAADELPKDLELDVDNTNPEEELKNYYLRVNGPVRNLVFDTLELRTTSIEVSISKSGREMTTHLTDRGEPIYRITETNPYKLQDIKFKLYHLNQSAKVTFAKRMGFPIMRYGHVLVYKNGFRVYPFGEPEEDTFGVEIRKSHKEFSRIGTRSLAGKIEINGDNPELVEATSRDAGLIHNETYEDLKRCYHEILRRFEKYVVDVIKWGRNIDPNSLKHGLRKEQLLDLIIDITGSEELNKLWYNENIVDILAAKQESSARTLLYNLLKVAEQTGSKEYMDDILLAQQRIQELEKITEQAEEIARDAKISVEEAKKALEFEQQKNKYLLSLDRSVSDDARNLLHNVKIVTQKIHSNIDILADKVKKDELDKNELLGRLEIIKVNADKAFRMSSLITKADFRGTQEKRTVEIASYIEEYVIDYISLFEDRPIEVEIIKKGSLFRKVSLLDLSIVIDNLLSNSEKKGAKKIRIEFRNPTSNQLEMIFSDNGNGLNKQFLQNPDIIFDLGITDTDGSGIGLHTVRSVLKDNYATIKFIGNGQVLKGAAFRILFN